MMISDITWYLYRRTFTRQSLNDLLENGELITSHPWDIMQLFRVLILLTTSIGCLHAQCTTATYSIIPECDDALASGTYPSCSSLPKAMANHRIICELHTAADLSVLKGVARVLYHGQVMIRNIPAWISNHMLSKVWDEVTYPFPNSNGCTVEVWEWISNSIPLYAMSATTYPCWHLS